ncbi:ABC transporter substrate-binding protein [Streptomyces sp. NPDC094032]|uniref:ABC transporter substrate-binding protein n=1 Tax=Streptomyces sp. NPDC094032 TaxID=3155308 RepID=UPI003327CB49
MHRPLRAAATALVLATALVTSLTSCTSTAGSSGPDKGASEADTTPVTLTFWHAFKDDREVDAVASVLDAFHRKYPYITVNAVKGQDDSKINQSLRGGTAPDVAASFNAGNVGGWCSSGGFQDLTPYITLDKLDLGRIPKAVRAYTEFDGKRCTMPWLADAFGLYYNKKLFAEAGITSPPKTMTELAEATKRLTRFKADKSIDVAGFMPFMGGYEMLPEHLVPSFGGTWLRPDGTSNTAADPAFTAALTWQKDLVDWFGAEKLKRFKDSLPDEFSAENAFHTGKIAMMVDGEWRNAFLKNDKAAVDYATAPMPVADDKPELYGSGFVGGNVIGIPRGGKHPGAAWKLVRFLTTDPDALAIMSNVTGNIPTTLDALDSPKLTLAGDPNMKVFYDIFKHPKTSSTPSSADGAAYLTNSLPFAEKWQLGQVPDLKAGLAELDRQNDSSLGLGR